LRRVALIRRLREWGRGALVCILWRKATARLSHMVSLLVVKPHADWRAHERGGRVMAAACGSEASTPTTSELRRAVLGRARPLRWAAMR
jgi:hypothetical protein